MDDESVFNPRSTVKRNGMIYGPLTLVMIFLVGVLVMSLFFRVNEIEVINASDYTDQEIVSASGIEKGVNLFFVDRFSAASMIFADLPYMDTVSITREMPDKIIIQAEGSAPAAYIRWDDEYWFIDRKGKMLGDTTALKAAALPEVRNLEPLTAIVGQEMIVEGINESRLAYTAELIPALQGEGIIDKISWIDVKDPANPAVFYDGRLTVYYGEMEDTAFKTALLRSAAEQMSKDDSGTLRYAGGSNWTFSPD